MEATPSEYAKAVVELLVQRGVRVVHVDEATGTMDALTGQLIEPPLLSSRERALGKTRWWAAELKLTPKMGIPNEIANRRHSIFYWAYDSVTQPTMMLFLVRDPPRPTNAELSEEIARRFNVLQERTLPALHRSYKAIDERVKRMEDMWTKAPELVYRPQEDDIVFCSRNRLNAPPEPLYRDEEKEKREQQEDEAFKRFKEQDHANNALMLSLIEYLKKVDVRLTVLEGKFHDEAALQKSMAHLQAQMERIFEHLRIKPLDEKKQQRPGPPQPPTPGGKLPVRAKEPSKEAPL